MSPTVYLAGPISGESYGACTDWRNVASADLYRAGIVGVSPMRAKDYLRGETSVGDSYEDRVLSSQRGIWGRDRFDSMRVDAAIINLLGAKKVSIGTCIEIGWLSSRNAPIILVMETSGNLHDHAMVREAAHWRVERVGDAVDVAKAILRPYAGLQAGR